MSVNPLLAKLGLSANDRAVIFHADDIGMCHASVAAYTELIEFGLISSAATMTPCGWFPATAVYCRTHQASHPHIDMGVHITLTSEWNNYRWGPLSTRDASTGLLDDEGYFFARSAPLQERAQAGAVRREVAAQIDRALAAGIDVTHMDSHMGSIFHMPFVPDYFATAVQYQIPALSLRASTLRLSWMGHGLPDTAVDYLAMMEDNGFPMLDRIEGMPLDNPTNRLETAKALLDTLPIGVSYFIVHPSVDTPELRTIAPDWENRVADYQLFTSEAWRKTVEASGVKVIGWRVIRELMRNA
jgi:predicted glycoside hydrolase/deacetylase ChbG (UPF0249 family)